MDRRVKPGDDAANGAIAPAHDAAIANPDNADCRPYLELHRGILLWSAGRKREAADWLEQCAAKRNGIIGSHYLAGKFLVERGQPRGPWVA